MVKRNLHSGIVDGGAVFEIVPHLRKVIVPSSHRVIGTEGEHCSEQITIRCPKTIDGHDIPGCAQHYVAWKNVEGEPGSDELDLVPGDGDMVSFKWVIRDALTAAKGLVSFSVHFEDKDENGKTAYKFSTTTCKDCEILESINNVVATYEAIYVKGNTLVIANYTPVTDGKAVINTTMMPEGILEITEDGEYSVGQYAGVSVVRSDAAPAVDVSKEGIVKATANGRETALQLSTEHDIDFTPENIRQGATIFGVTGAYKPTITFGINDTNGRVVAFYRGNEIAHVEISKRWDPDFVPENIKAGVNIFGVEGTCQPVKFVQVTFVNNQPDKKMYIYCSTYSQETSGMVFSNISIEHGETKILNIALNSLLLVRVDPSFLLNFNPTNAFYRYENFQLSGMNCYLIRAEESADGSRVYTSFA